MSNAPSAIKPASETAAEKVPPLPERITSVIVANYRIPTLIRAMDNGWVAVREGRDAQCKHQTEVWFTEDKQEGEMFEIKAQNSINICGHSGSVLNDEGDFRGRRLFASAPSCSEYMAHVGKPTVINFTSEPVNVRSAAYVRFKRERIYKNVRVTILELP